MKYIGLLAWVLVFVSPALTRAVAGAAGGQPLDLNIQMIPGIWITDAYGTVRIEYTTTLDQTNGWTLLASVQATNSPYFYADATATNAPKRFYRAVADNSGNTNQPTQNPDPAHLVWISPGTFMMGSPTNEVPRYFDDVPPRVTLTRGFWMSKYETTQEEYQAVMGSNPSFYSGDPKRPVEHVGWEDATNYCAKLTASERAAGRLPAGYEYRLPTEAEWEYACRAGTTTRFSYGDDPGYSQLGDYAWYLDNSGWTTHPVGGKKPNRWGLYDMHGNVWEFSLDSHQRPLPGGSETDPRGSTTGPDRLMRGGSYKVDGGLCRSASWELWAVGEPKRQDSGPSLPSFVVEPLSSCQSRCASVLAYCKIDLRREAGKYMESGRSLLCLKCDIQSRGGPG